eukprot:5488117-Prymnesium_polylepis.1
MPARLSERGAEQRADGALAFGAGNVDRAVGALRLAQHGAEVAARVGVDPRGHGCARQRLPIRQARDAREGRRERGRVRTTRHFSHERFYCNQQHTISRAQLHNIWLL